jgi:hypothetical protein
MLGLLCLSAPFRDLADTLMVNNGGPYTECQALYPVVRIRSSHPLTRKRVLLVPFGFTGGRHTGLWGDGVEGPNSDDGTAHLVLIGYTPSTLPQVNVGKNRPPSRTNSTQLIGVYT